ncbi:trypsin-like serine peptidase [Rhizobium leguminosarum]|uniref:trypsin-like serine peptidase n=1 Tax=Rhizobium leguminosarum TaxID=384 RepID=UPI003F9B4F37
MMTVFRQMILLVYLTALTSIGYSSLALGWGIHPPEGVVNEINTSFQVDDVPGANLWRSGPQVVLNSSDAISLEIGGEFGSFGDAELFVFDHLNNLVDVIKLSNVANNSLWTEYVDGGTISLEIKSSTALPQTSISILRYAVRSAGTHDQVVDGIPDFQSPDTSDQISGITDTMKESTARLIVGQNSFPLEKNLPSKTPDWCTGFMVGPKLLMTASHCIKSKSASCPQIVALFGYGLNVSEKITAYRCSKISYYNAYIDTAIVELDGTPADIAIASLAFRPVVFGEALKVVQHPYGAVRLVSADGACKVMNINAAARPSHGGLDHALLDGVAFTHGCDTVNGSSGSPIFAIDGLVVGIHQGGDRAENTGLKIEVVLSCIKIQSNNVIILRPDSQICKNEI